MWCLGLLKTYKIGVGNNEKILCSRTNIEKFHGIIEASSVDEIWKKIRNGNIDGASLNIPEYTNEWSWDSIEEADEATIEEVEGDK